MTTTIPMRVLVTALLGWLAPLPGVAAEGHCSRTARISSGACQHEVRDDHATAGAICVNESDDTDRARCRSEAGEERDEGLDLCREQLAARLDVCASLGEGRYDPDFDPRSFEDEPDEPATPNPYFPLGIGHRWEYRGGSEVVTVEVLDETKSIEGVTCLVVNDRVSEDGRLVEDTDDWYAHARDGSIWYCGEQVKDFESFEGDDPEVPELVSIDGSFKAGRDGDQPGIRFPGVPMPGQAYRQEFSLGNAEDVAEVVSTTYAFGDDPDLDRFVPRRLASLLCAADCVVTRDRSPLEPGVVERKYHARGIGTFLEVKPETGEVIQLVDCNFDPRCRELPTP